MVGCSYQVDSHSLKSNTSCISCGGTSHTQVYLSADKDDDVAYKAIFDGPYCKKCAKKFLQKSKEGES